MKAQQPLEKINWSKVHNQFIEQAKPFKKLSSAPPIIVFNILKNLPGTTKAPSVSVFKKAFFLFIK